MKPEQAIQSFVPRVIVVTFAACWVFGIESLLLAFGMGFELGYSTSDEEGVSERVGCGFKGGFVGIMGGFAGVLAFYIVVKLVTWITGVELGDVSFFEHRHDE